MNGIAGDGSPNLRRFPPGFLWGTGTSSYQVEGGVHDDGRGVSIWDTFTHTPGKVNRGDTGDIACDSYHRLDEDLRLLSELGVSAYRFSVAWPRVQPDGRGAINQRGLDYYRSLVEGLRGLGIVPVATVYHWELPQALEDIGGWPRRDTANRFAEYAELVARALGDQVGMWITINEPRQAAHQGYRTGTHAPGKTDLGLAAAATHHLLLGHGLAVEAIRGAVPGRIPVGIAIDVHPVRAASEDVAPAAAAIYAEDNHILLEPLLHASYPAAVRPELLPGADLIEPDDMACIAAPIDFLGLNYYTPYYIRAGDWDDLRFSEKPVPGYPGVVSYVPTGLSETPMGWIIEPEGLYDALRALDREAPQLPIYITENGCAAEDYVNPSGTVDDDERIAYLDGHLDAALRAIADGVNLAGYFHWALMDNFEWARGYQRRFGLYYVDFGTQRRLAKRSAAFYGTVARMNALPDRDGARPEEALAAAGAFRAS